MPGKTLPTLFTPGTVITACWDLIDPDSRPLDQHLRSVILDQLMARSFDANRPLDGAGTFKASDLNGVDVTVAYPEVSLVLPGRSEPVTSTRLLPLPHTLSTYSPQWSHDHPLDQALAAPTDRSAIRDLGRMLDYLTMRACGLITGRLHDAVRSGRLRVHGMVTNDPIAGIQPIKLQTLQQHFRLNLFETSITFDHSPVRITQIVFVRGDGSTPAKQPSSLEEADLPLINEMHRLITSGEIASISAAARALAGKAAGTGSLNSRAERLRHRYRLIHGKTRKSGYRR